MLSFWQADKQEDRQDTGKKNMPLIFSLGGIKKINTLVMFNPLPDGKILDWSKLKQIADDILKCI